MSTDELRAAADRLRRLKAGKEKSQDIYGVTVATDNPRSPEFQEACRRVKRLILDDERAAVAAFIDLHPTDDGEPITAEYLTACGFRRTGGGWYRIGEDGTDSTLALDYHDSQENGDVFRLPTNGFQPGRVLVETRGQLRTLCRAFGVQLKESP